MTPVRIPVQCPNCDSPNDGHEDIDGTGAIPEPDDLSICAYCGTLAWYKLTDGVWSLVEVTPEESATLMKEPEILAALSLVRSMQDGRSGER